eukprot:TRINITY_DN76282_c0_g1_i1.p1 TRINITY_DN76282_c0_g1~~TRINITY_DN76282_c0_g1_i1.p1  ORF type:complete len:282 (-),score=33.99 TRINITY_DN76282_c0_g1_i1:66-911(-)
MKAEHVTVCGGDYKSCMASCGDAPQLKAASQGGTANEDEQSRCKQFCKTRFDLVCFPGDSTVMVRGRGRVQIAELKVGDSVLALLPSEESGWKVCFDPLIAFLHYAPEIESEALRIQHELGHVELTSTHLLFVEKHCSRTDGAVPLMAREVSVGDRLLAPWVDGNLSRPKVLNIERVMRRGFFAPLSRCGTLLVDGTAASCYAIPGDLAEAPGFCQIVQAVGASNLHSLCQAVFLPFRAVHQLALQKKPESALVPSSSKILESFHPYAWFCYVLGANLLIA